MLRRKAWALAERLGLAETYDAEFVALTQLQADALVTPDNGAGPPRPRDRPHRDDRGAANGLRARQAGVTFAHTGPNNDDQPGRTLLGQRRSRAAVLSTIAASGDQAIAFVILGSIVIPLAALGWLCWFFWKHRHDE